jgi:hypothetical protein
MCLNMFALYQAWDLLWTEFHSGELSRHRFPMQRRGSFLKAACLQISQTLSRKQNLRKMYYGFKKGTCKWVQVMIYMLFVHG